MSLPCQPVVTPRTAAAHWGHRTATRRDQTSLLESLERVLASYRGLFVVDEAYAPFANENAVSLLARHPNLVVVRTLSKVGMAGIRLGYAAGHPAWIAELDKVRPPYNVNSLTQAVVPVLLRHYEVASNVVTEVLTGVTLSADFADHQITLEIGSQDEAELSTLIPTQLVDTTRFPKASDAGSALPVVFGADGLCRPPYVSRDEEGSSNDAGGRDFVVDSKITSKVIAVFFDEDKWTPGLEAGTSWSTGYGSPTRITSCTGRTAATRAYGICFCCALTIIERCTRAASGSAWIPKPRRSSSLRAGRSSRARRRCPSWGRIRWAR